MEYRITVDEKSIRVEAFNHFFEVERHQWRDMPESDDLDLTWTRIGELIAEHLREKYKQAEATR